MKYKLPLMQEPFATVYGSHPSFRVIFTPAAIFVVSLI